MEKDFSRFKPYNVKAITASFKKVFETGDISHLTKEAYVFTTLYFGFIAHYNHHGFMETYRNDMATFTENIALCAGNHSNPQRYVKDKWFQEQYGLPYCQSIADIGTPVTIMAGDALDKMKQIDYLKGKSGARQQIESLQQRYDL